MNILLRINNEQRNVALPTHAADCSLLLNDLCSIVFRQPSTFLKRETNDVGFVLELTESMLLNGVRMFRFHSVFCEVIVSTHVCQCLKGNLAECIERRVAQRVFRLARLVMTRYHDVSDETEELVAMLNKIVLYGMLWQRCFAAEVSNEVCKDAALVQWMFERFDIG